VSVLHKEREGEPFVEIGQLPDRTKDVDLIERLLPARKPTWLYGEEGVGKGNLAAAMCVCVGAGMSFVGLKVQPGRVLYLDWEDDAETLDARLKSIARGIGVDTPKMLYRSCRGPLRSQVHQIAKQKDAFGAAFGVIDSVGLAAGGGGERGAPEDSALWLFEAMRELDMTLLCIDHVNKAAAADKNAPAKAYGSMYKMALARNAWEIRKDQEVGASMSHLGLYHRKTNNGPIQQPIGLRLEWQLDGTLRFYREDVRESEVLSSTLSIKTRMVHHLQKNGMSDVQEMADSLGVRKEQIRVELSRNKALFYKMPESEDLYGLLENFR
jgi:RecA-family ATPase